VYAYLLSTLPDFDLDGAPPMSLVELVERCRGFLPEPELTGLEDPEAAAKGSGDSARAARRWLDGERQLANAVARRRAPFWELSPADQAREHGGFSVMLEDGAGRAFEAAHPLARQRALDELRWQLLNELAGPVPWGFPALFAYARRLEIAWQWAPRQPAAGRDALGRILDAVEERAVREDHFEEHHFEEHHD